MSPRAKARSGGGNIPTRYQFPRLVEEVHGPWLGVRDGPAMTEGDAQHAQMFMNSYIADPGQGGAVLARPGWEILNAAGQLYGIPSNRYPQGIACYNPPSGGTTIANIYAFVGGRMFQVTSATGIGTPVDVTPGTIAISPNAQYVWSVNYAGLLVVSDGVNPPWTWDGVTATYIDWDLSGNPAHTVAYGPPTVYYDQLFFVCNTGSVGNRTTLIWSEPNNAALGYIQTVAGFTYADTWTLAQTGSDDIQCMLGTNTALFYWRKGSTGALYGSPALNFATTATHDAVSSTTGTLMAKSVVTTDREIYFLDQTGKPHVIEYGGYIVEIWQDSAATLGAAAAQMLPATPGVQGNISVPRLAGVRVLRPQHQMRVLGAVVDGHHVDLPAADLRARHADQEVLRPVDAHEQGAAHDRVLPSDVRAERSAGTVRDAGQYRAAPGLGREHLPLGRSLWGAATG